MAAAVDDQLCGWRTESMDHPMDRSPAPPDDAADPTEGLKSMTAPAVPSPPPAPPQPLSDTDAAPPEEEVEATEPTARKQLRRLVKGTKLYFDSYSPRNVVLLAALGMGYAVTKDPTEADVVWFEAEQPPERCRDIAPRQRINYLPGLRDVTRKCAFGVLMTRMQALFPGEFDFIPRTFALPMDAAPLAAFGAAHPGQVYIVKPDAGCGGDGIYLTGDRSEIRHPECVVQCYVPDPLLLSGLKFDLRLYVLVTSAAPLRYFLFHEGLARFAVEPYQPPSRANYHKLNMHLTNYSLNKFSSDFVENTDAYADDECSKRTVSTAFRQLRAEHPSFDEEAFWDATDSLVGRTLAACIPHMLSAVGDDPRTPQFTSRGFQVLGFDVFLDSSLEPHLLEINCHPSLMTDAPVDVRVKEPLLRATMALVAHDAHAHRRGAAERRAERRRTKAAEPSPPPRSRSRSRPGHRSPSPDTSPATVRHGLAQRAAAAAEWEEEVLALAQSLDEDTAPCTVTADAAADTDRFTAPFEAALRVFVEACGGARGTRGNSYATLTSTRFVRMLRRCGFCGPGSAVSTAEVDLLFIKCTQRSGLSYLTFNDFLAALLDDLGAKLTPDTPRLSLVRLTAVTAMIEAGAAAS